MTSPLDNYRPKLHFFTPVYHCVHGWGSLYDATSCLAAWFLVPCGKGGLCAWSYVLSGGLCLGFCMMSLPIWLPGPMFLLVGVSVNGSMFLPRGLCPGGSLSGRPPGQRLPLYSKERAVRILLECFLVSKGSSVFRLF